MADAVADGCGCAETEDETGDEFLLLLAGFMDQLALIAQSLHIFLHSCEASCAGAGVGGGDGEGAEGDCGGGGDN
ncbi:MAG: hypothetical protein JXQ99_09650 [Hyphomicrobiaceae bacterium]